MLKRQVVVGSGSGLVGAVWWVFVRGVSWKQVCNLQVVRGLGVWWDKSVVSGPKGGTGYIDVHAAPGAQQWGLMLKIHSSFSELKLPAPSSWGIF